MNFKEALSAALASRGIPEKSFCDLTNIAESTILMEYGAVFLADFFTRTFAADMEKAISSIPFPFTSDVGEAIAKLILATQVKIPSKCIFENAAAVDAFQQSVIISKENIGGITIELQVTAMWALKMAVEEAKTSGQTITPRPDATGARRTYAETVKFWNDKITSGIAHWTKNSNKKGNKLPQAEANILSTLSGSAQIKKVLELEQQGFFFSTFHNKTILRSVAAPGTSQHLLMLALDIKEFDNKKVRDIMAKFGWFQTVFQDQPHFTYLGMAENKLNTLGLMKKSDGGQDFWIPKP